MWDKDNLNWTTADEMTFIRNIGMYSDVGWSYPYAISLLEGYIASVARRKNWGKIHAPEALAAAQARLAELKVAAARADAS